MEDYIKVNRALWNLRTSVHLKSDFYQMEAFKAGQSSLKAIELSFLEEVKG